MRSNLPHTTRNAEPGTLNTERSVLPAAGLCAQGGQGGKLIGKSAPLGLAQRQHGVAGLAAVAAHGARRRFQRGDAAFLEQLAQRGELFLGLRAAA